MPRPKFIDRVRRAAKSMKTIGGRPELTLWDISDAEAVELWMAGAVPARFTRYSGRWETWFSLQIHSDPGARISAFTLTRPALAWEIEGEGGSIAPSPPPVVVPAPAPAPVEVASAVPEPSRFSLLEVF